MKTALATSAEIHAHALGVSLKKCGRCEGMEKMQQLSLIERDRLKGRLVCRGIENEELQEENARLRATRQNYRLAVFALGLISLMFAMSSAR